MSTSSARLPAPKIHVSCPCGKKYRVPAAKAGKKITCKACGEKVRVAREAGVSERSRGNILAELGIDPVAAEQAYRAEVDRRSQPKKTYHCTRCEGDIGAHELNGAYVQGELVCPGCRASEVVADRRAERERDGKPKKAAVELVSDYRDPKKALASALGFGALFFVGVLGPLWAVVGLRFVWAFAIALGVAGAGAGAVYKHHA